MFQRNPAHNWKKKMKKKKREKGDKMTTHPRAAFYSGTKPNVGINVNVRTMPAKQNKKRTLFR